MDPVITAALAKTGGDLIASLFAPSVKKQLKWQRESEQKQAAWKAGQVASALKPATPYYQSGNLPQLGSAAMQAVMGNLAQRMGPELMAKWGINPAAAPVQAQAAPLVGMPGRPVIPGMAQQPQGFPGQELLLRRYGYGA